MQYVYEKTFHILFYKVHIKNGALPLTVSLRRKMQLKNDLLIGNFNKRYQKVFIINF